MTTIKPVDFRSLCCQVAPKNYLERSSITSTWHELTGDGKSTLMAYGICSECNKEAQFKSKE